jgi:NAD(P)-dependent dehydrogenase (short-subunit alcohol dehydrogenase family)
MLQFQGLMARFLDTQRAVTLAYLQGTQASVPEALAATAAAPLAAPSAVVHVPPPVPVGAPAVVVPVPSAPEVPVIVPLAAAPAAGNGHAASAPDQAHLTEQLLRIVGERTGYPPEMLDLDVDIEADLGIDSIKRVEILGNVQRVCIPADRQVAEKAMEQLTGIKTLRGIVGWLENALAAENGHVVGGNGHAKGNGNGNGHGIGDGNGNGNGKANGHAAVEGLATEATPDGPAESAGAPAAAHPATEDELVVIPRSVLAVVDAPALRSQAGAVDLGGVVLVTDDEGGIAHAVCEELRSRGARVVLLRHHDDGLEATPAEPGVHRANLGDAAGVALLMEQLRRDEGPVGGIVHLLPLAGQPDFEAMDLAAWRAALRRDVKSLFYLAREAGRDLKQAAGDRNAWLLAATPMGGAYAPPGAPRTFFPGAGAIAGLVKSLALEWPGVHCKVVALDTQDAAAVRADALLMELAAADGLVEVAYTGGRRRTLQLRLAPLATPEVRLAIEPGSVVLVTGGARGITAEVACDLAERYRPTLLLVGRSPLPEPEESPATRDLASPMAIKAALLDAMRREGETVTVARVEAACQRLLKDREIRANLARMERAGSTVRYYEADARDESALGALVEEAYREYGRLDGVIHGAGVIEDKLVEDKTPESFDRVFDTKAESAFVLSRILRPESLKFLAFFGSASAPFGNRGQADYAAANEVLNKLALHLDRSWPGRVVTLSWGPWLKTGMVSPELQKEFARRGIELISIPAGCRLFDQELRHGAKGEPEVILAGGAWSAPSSESRAARPASTAPLPLLQGARVSSEGGHVVEAVRTFDPDQDLYLLDHQMDGSPVVPMAVALELMAELAQKGWPDLHVIGLRELQLLKGVVLDKGPRAVRVIARAQVEPPHDRTGVDVNVELREPSGSGPVFYRATVELAATMPEPPRYVPMESESLRAFPMSVEDAYREWLFHGPRLAGITGIEGIADRTIHAVLDASAPPPCFKVAPEGRWLVDPVMFDSGLQLFLLWARANLDKTPLPSRFSRYRRFGSLSESKIRCHMRVLERSRDPLYYMNVAFIGPDGRLLGLLEEMEGACSRSLNRLAVRARSAEGARAHEDAPLVGPA